MRENRRICRQEIANYYLGMVEEREELGKIFNELDRKGWIGWMISENYFPIEELRDKYISLKRGQLI